jgi:diguanylate cyclase (GGDEF)-like protein
MNLDLLTVLWVTLFVTFLLAAAVLAVAWLSRVDDGLVTWGWALLFNGGGSLTLMLRQVGWTATSIVVSSGLTSVAMALHIQALVRFQRARVPAPPVALVWGPLPLMLALSLALVERHQLRSVLNSAIWSFQMATLVWLAWSPRLSGPREQGRRLLALSAASLMLVFAYRVGLFIRTDEWDDPMVVPSQIQTVSYLMGHAAILLSTLGFVLLQKERALELLRQQATHDPLTGAANRRTLMDQLERSVSLAARNRQPLALLMIDIDYFKKVNDNYGHQAGDTVLCELVRRIEGRVRQQDVLARFGGEEFVVLLPATDAAGACVVAEDIRRAIQEQPFAIEGQALPITVSVGVHTRVPEVGPKVVGQMVEACDQAMYTAKQNGRNRVELL